VQGSLFSSPLSGYSAVVWARISYDDRAVRIANKTLEWVWAPSKSLGTSAMTLAHTLKVRQHAAGKPHRDSAGARDLSMQDTRTATAAIGSDFGVGLPLTFSRTRIHANTSPSHTRARLQVHYSSPPNTCWDLVMCNGGEALAIDPTLEGYNAPAAVADFVSYLDGYSASYRGTELLVLMGDDFQHQDPGMLVNIDRLIAATNALQPGGPSNGTYKVFYSTAAKWADAVLASGTSFPMDTVRAARGGGG
jgi:hypothetical protein